MELPGVRTDYELRTQLGAAAAAVAANIAEGFGQQSDRQVVKYLFVARGSCNEVRAHLEVALGRKYLEEVAKMLSGLIKYLRRSDRKFRG